MQTLEALVMPSFVLRDPFMIASSHWTESERSFRQLATVSPAAVTLKTTSAQVGGTGTAALDKRSRHAIVNTFGSRIGYHADGPKLQEFWNIATTVRMAQTAKRLLQSSNLGLSVLYGEDYAELARRLPMELYSYAELNWKYTFRGIPSTQMPEAISMVVADLRVFLDVFAALPRLVKVPAEVVDIFAEELFEPVRKVIYDDGAALLIANSKRLRVPPSRVGIANPRELPNGVVFGDYLFLSTFNLIKQLGQLRDTGRQIPPIIATGGVTDIGAVVDVLAAGASAVQLCTALDLRGPEVVNWLREQLHRLAGEGTALNEFVNTIRGSADAWQRAVVMGRQSALNSDHVGEVIRSKALRVEEIVAETIVAELGSPGHTDMPLPVERPANSAKYSFVITKGNVGSYLLSQGCAREGRFTAIDLEDGREFRTRLIAPDFSWDFVIFPRSIIEDIQREGRDRLAERYPEIVTTVGTSIIEVVGHGEDSVDTLQTIFHFVGATASAAIDVFLGQRAGSDRYPEFEEVNAGSILPTLHFWRRGRGVMAKHPLTQIYGLLTPGETSAKWASLWQSREELVLACSVAFLKQEGAVAVRDWVLSSIADLRRHHVSNSRKSAHELVTTGFLVHCARLLGGRRDPTQA